MSSSPAARRLVSALHSLREFVSPARLVQPKADFHRACVLLDMKERVVAQRPTHEIESSLPLLNDKYRGMSLGDKMSVANDAMTVQIADMFQALYDLDSGGVAAPEAPQLPSGATNAGIEASVGPSTHTNPLVTMESQVATLAAEDKLAARKLLAEYLGLRLGFSLWVGPSQAQTPENTAGVYIKGYAPPGTVVALYPGRTYSSEMMLKAKDFAHLANPDVPRHFVVRFDGTLIDVNGVIDDDEVATDNPFAIGQHVRHPPQEITPNLMRIQYDFMVDEDESSLPLLPFPKHLRRYVPNQWGSEVSMGQSFAGSLVDQGIFMKGSALITTREVADEELFVDHQLNPMGKLPSWYTPIDRSADERLWQSVIASAKVKQ